MKDITGRVYQVDDFIAGGYSYFTYLVLQVEANHIVIKGTGSGANYTIQQDDNIFRILEPEELI